MIMYGYRYRDGDKEEFQHEEMRLTEHNGRPCHRLYTTGFVLKEGGSAWPGKEASGRTTNIRTQRNADGSVSVTK